MILCLFDWKRLKIVFHFHISNINNPSTAVSIMNNREKRDPEKSHKITNQNLISHNIFNLIHHPTTLHIAQPAQGLGHQSLLLDKMHLEELLNRVGVPFVDSQRLLHFAVLIQQFDNWIGASSIPDLESGEC